MIKKEFEQCAMQTCNGNALAHVVSKNLRVVVSNNVKYSFFLEVDTNAERNGIVSCWRN